MYTLTVGTVPDGATINFVKAYYRCDYVQIALTTTIQGYARLKIGANYYDSTASTLTTIFVTYNYTWANNPATGVAWTQADILALIAGPALYTGNVARRIPQCSQFYIEVDYTEAGGAVAKRLLRNRVHVGL